MEMRLTTAYDSPIDKHFASMCDFKIRINNITPKSMSQTINAKE